MLPNPGAKLPVFLGVEWTPIGINLSPQPPFVRHNLLVVDRSVFVLTLLGEDLLVSDSGLLIHDYSERINPIK